MYILLIFVRILTLIVATSETFKTQMNNLNSNSTNLNLDNLEGEIEIIKDSPTSTTSSVNKPSVNSPSSVWSKYNLSYIFCCFYFYFNNNSTIECFCLCLK